MKKIVFHLNCLERGGAERVVSNLSGQFVQNGYKVWIARLCNLRMFNKKSIPILSLPLQGAPTIGR